MSLAPFYVRCSAMAAWLLMVAAVDAFEIKDLPRMQDRLTFFRQGCYAVGTSKTIGVDAASREKLRNLELAVYFVGENQYDRCFAVRFGHDITVSDTPDAVVFTSGHRKLTVTPEGVEFLVDAKYPEGKHGERFCWIEIDRIRFDDARAYRDRGNRVETYSVRSYQVSAIRDEAVPARAEEHLAESADFKPDYAVRTEEGLWTLWAFDLEAEGAEGLYDNRDARLMIAGGGGTPVFYNVARTIAPGGAVHMRLRFRAEPEEGYPLTIPPAPQTTMIDSHLHVTAITDSRDSALMARKHGYKFGLLSILYMEGTYGRHFTGDEQMFEAVARYPDVFIGFGLVQLNAKGFPGYPRQGPDTPEHIQRLRKKGCKGLKTLVKWSKNEVMVDDSKYDPLYAKAAEFRMPIVFHTEGEKYGSSHTRVAAAARKHPGCPMILAHLSGDQIEAMVRELKRTPNLYVQHMHLGRPKDEQGRTALARLVEEGLADRIVFGSDLQNDHSPLIHEYRRFRGELEALAVPEETIEAIMFGTMERLLEGVRSAAQVAAP
jgi:predicted TIM-barrel fold metal-dependent hydrolase